MSILKCLVEWSRELYIDPSTTGLNAISPITGTLNKLINRWMDGWMDGWIVGWMDGWMDRQTDRQINWTDGQIIKQFICYVF